MIGDKLLKKAIMTAISQITGYMSLANAQMLGQDLMEITAHAGARSSHAEWQGQIVSLSGRRGYLSLSDIGYGEPDGFKGVNCRHDWYPFFEGISEPAYTKEQLENIDPPPFEFERRFYTFYEANQKQRQIERAIRKTKRELIAYEAAGLKDDFTAASIKLRRQRELYRDFSRAANLREKLERTGVYGYNKNISSKSVWTAKKSKLNLQLFSEKDLSKQKTNSLKKGIKNFKKRISEHEDKINNPEKYIFNWYKLDEREKAGLIKHWQKEIDNFNKSIQNRIDELKRRGEDYE